MRFFGRKSEISTYGVRTFFSGFIKERSLYRYDVSALFRDVRSKSDALVGSVHGLFVSCIHATGYAGCLQLPDNYPSAYLVE